MEENRIGIPVRINHVSLLEQITAFLHLQCGDEADVGMLLFQDSIQLVISVGVEVSGLFIAKFYVT